MIRGVTLAALVATATAWSTSGCPNPPCMEDCWVKDSCSKCVADVNCGWCSVTKTCMEGVIMGPLSSNCSAWDYAFCSGEPCATYRTCSTCMSDPFCGWCPSTQLCSEGNKNGPLFGKCGDREHGAMQSGCNSDGPPQAEAVPPLALTRLPRLLPAALRMT